MCIRADLVVLAAPLDPVVPNRFRVSSVLAGKGARTGEVLAPGLRAEDVKAFDEVDLAGTRKPRPRRSENALLFFQGGKLLGLRLLTRDGRVMGLDGKGKVELRRSRWSELVNRVREDLTTVRRLRGYRALARPERKTAALVAWVERNRASLLTCSPAEQDDESPACWEELALGVFDWMIETGDHACAWRAVRLYAELHGELLLPRQPVFGSPAGREFLLSRAKDAAGLAGDRARALLLLSAKEMLWPGMTKGEQAKRIDAVAGLLADESPDVRLAAVKALGRLSLPEVPDRAGWRTTRAREALAAVYRTSSGPVRQEVAWLLAGLGGGDSPAGAVVILREVEVKGGHLTFWLHLRTPGAKVHENPEVLLERLTYTGAVAETKRQELEVVFLPRPWKDGWGGEAPLPARLPLKGLQAGWKYRLRVEGFVGAGGTRQKWLSEPWTFTVPGRRGDVYGRR